MPALAIGALVLLPGTSYAQLSGLGPAASFEDAPVVTNPLYEQYDECIGAGPPSQQLLDGEFGGVVLQAADDFSNLGSKLLSQVVALGVLGGEGPLGPITFELYQADGPGSLPGTLVCFEEGLVSADAGSIDVTLDGSCEIGTGAYWVSVFTSMSFDEEGLWFWNSNANGFGNQFAYQDPDGLLYPECTTWGFGLSDCGIAATFPDLCYGVGVLEDTGDGGGVPAVGTTGAIVMLLVVMALSFFYLRRRQTA
jgi:hypothetical protein